MPGRNDISEQGYVKVEDGRIHASANALGRIEDAIIGRNVDRLLKRNVMNSCIVPARVCELETHALTQQQRRRQRQ